MLLVDLTLVDEANQCETLVHLAQVQHNVLLVVVGVGQSDDAARLFVKLGTAFLIHTVDACDVYHDFDELTADLVVLHVDWIRVRADVDLANHVEKESLLNF